MAQDVNRVKLVLVEKKRTNKWFSEQVGKDPATVSKWITNKTQPSLDVLIAIANALEVSMQDIVRQEEFN